MVLRHRLVLGKLKGEERQKTISNLIFSSMGNRFQLLKAPTWATSESMAKNTGTQDTQNPIKCSWRILFWNPISQGDLIYNVLIMEM